MNLFNKPKGVKLNLDDLKITDLEYWCASRHLDKIVCVKLNRAWSEATANELEAKARHYFVVTTSLQHDIIEGPVFEKWYALQLGIEYEDKVIERPKMTDKATKARDHYIKAIVDQFKRRKR